MDLASAAVETSRLPALCATSPEAHHALSRGRLRDFPSRSPSGGGEAASCEGLDAEPSLFDRRVIFPSNKIVDSYRVGESVRCRLSHLDAFHADRWKPRACLRSLDAGSKLWFHTSAVVPALA